MPGYWWKHVRYAIWRVAEHKYFSRFFLFLILVNTVILAIEYPGMDPRTADILSTVNLALTQLFTLEVVVKVGLCPSVPFPVACCPPPCSCLSLCLSLCLCLCLCLCLSLCLSLCLCLCLCLPPPPPFFSLQRHLLQT